MNITIVGAGIVGCAVAYECAARGAAVTVVDARGVGMGATQASAGILAPRIEGHSPSLLKLTQSSLDAYDAFVARLRSDGVEEFEYERNGTFQVALNVDEAAALAREATRCRTEDVECTLLDGASARRLEPTIAAGATAALLVPSHGYAAVSAMTHALSEGAANRGATFIAASARLRTDDTGCAQVLAGDCSLDSDAIVVAAGSWSSEVAASGRLPEPVRPIRGQLLHLRAPERVASRVIWGERCYVVPWRDGSVLVGATVEDVGFDEHATVAGVRELLDAATELVPVLAGARFEAVRVGLRPMTGDELPVIGASNTMPNVFYATGHYRNGVLLAPLTASLVGDLVLEGRERPELALTRPARVGL